MDTIQRSRKTQGSERQLGNEFHLFKVVMKINRSLQPMVMFYTLYNCIFQQANKTIYPAIMVSNDLSWKPHVEYRQLKWNN